MATSPATPNQKSSLAGTMISVVMLTLIGAGTGLGVGAMLASAPSGDAAALMVEPPATAAASHGAAAADTGHGESEAPAGHDTASAAESAAAIAAFDIPAPVIISEPMVVVPLEPIVTNLAAPEGVWLRIEASLLASKEHAHAPVTLAQDMTMALLTYIRTLRLSDIEGSSGFLAFRDDIDDLVKIASHGVAERVLIRSLVVE